MAAAKKAEGRVLASTVHIDGEIYPAGSTPPDDVAERITNPKAWADGSAPATETNSSQEKDSENAGGSGSATNIPSKVSGSAAAWRDYALAAAAAKGLNIDIPEDAKRKDIISALDDAGIATAAG